MEKFIRSVSFHRDQIDQSSYLKAIEVLQNKEMLYFYSSILLALPDA